MIDSQWRMVRFGLAGGINTAVDIVLFSTLVFGFDISVVLANLMSFAVALFVSFLLNRYWVFATQSAGILRFAVANILTALMATTALWGAVQLGLPVLLAKFAATGLSMVLNFVLLSRFVFRQSQPR